MSTFSQIPNSSAKSSPDIFPFKKLLGLRTNLSIIFSFGYNVLKPLVSTSVNFKLERIILKLRKRKTVLFAPSPKGRLASILTKRS